MFSEFGIWILGNHVVNYDWSRAFQSAFQIPALRERRNLDLEFGNSSLLLGHINTCHHHVRHSSQHDERC